MVKLTETKLKKLYKKYIEGKYFYRVSSKEYLSSINRNGLNPQQNPYEKKKQKIIYLCKLLEKLEKKGYFYVYTHWPRSKPLGSIISRMFQKSLKNNYIDLTPNNFGDLVYYKKRKGGDIPLTINHIGKDLIKGNYPLTKKDKNIIDSLLKWSGNKVGFKNTTIRIPADSSFLEKADLQRFLGKKYLPSPYGSFENFKKTILKHGIKIYLPYFEGKEEYYLRFKHKIPVEEIEVIG
jgi:hypothetical protein